MILDEIKLLVKDMEDVLVKDKRFKDFVKLKKQVKGIYGTTKIEYQPLYIPYPTIGPAQKCEEKVVTSNSTFTPTPLPEYERGVLADPTELVEEAKKAARTGIKTYGLTST